MIKYVHWKKKLQEDLAAFSYILFHNVYRQSECGNMARKRT